jgi:hypothetical protein
MKDNVQKVNHSINIPLSQTFISYLHLCLSFDADYPWSFLCITVCLFSNVAVFNFFSVGIKLFYTYYKTSVRFCVLFKLFYTYYKTSVKFCVLLLENNNNSHFVHNRPLLTALMHLMFWLSQLLTRGSMAMGMDLTA